MIVGSGRLGIGLARALSSRQDDVVVIDHGLDAGRFLDDFDGVMVDGDPMDMTVLEKSGIRQTGLFIAVTADDNVNIVCAQAARKLFGVPKALARIADPEREAFFKKIGVNTVCPTATGINQVLEIIQEDRFGSLNTSLDHSLICIHPLNQWVGLPLSEIKLPSDIHIVGLLRNGKITHVARREVVRSNDTIVISNKAKKQVLLWNA
ncbi:MAG: TrkA family potassium uptake protein [Spirochaetaceae bacterium]|nr:TrkA family potassium uptake protein [Spirochaetaceae bacterium]